MVSAPADATIPAARSYAFLIRGQALHAFFLALFVPTAYALAAPALSPLGAGWLGRSDRAWFDVAIWLAVTMQVVVWLGWRLQLGWGLFTRLFGRFDLTVWGALFLALLVARPLAVLAVGLADRDSLAISPRLSLVLGALTLGPALWAMASVRRHFGVARAVGGDHFRLAYRAMPPVTQGAFAVTPNAMYLLVALLLWSIAFFLRSHAALVAAIFQYAFVWGHYLGTEKPDLELMHQAPDPGPEPGPLAREARPS